MKRFYMERGLITMNEQFRGYTTTLAVQKGTMNPRKLCFHRCFHRCYKRIEYIFFFTNYVERRNEFSLYLVFVFSFFFFFIRTFFAIVVINYDFVIKFWSMRNIYS